MSKSFTVKVPKTPQTESGKTGEYIVATCPKCGKKTYGIAGQKGKKCPVCRHSYPMPGGTDAPRFKTPEEACRFIQAEETKRAGRLDFTPAAGGFHPTFGAPVIDRTEKKITKSKTIDAQFASWARQYFLRASENICTGLPTNEFIAAAAKAGFVGADKLIEKAITSGLLIRPKSYSVWLAKPVDL